MRKSRNLRGGWFGISLLMVAVALLVTSAAFALVRPDEDSPLRQKAFRAPVLDYGNIVRPLAELPPNLVGQLEQELTSLEVAPGNGYFDLRTGRWGTLILSEPMIPGRGMGNRLAPTSFKGAAGREQAALEAFRAFIVEHVAQLRLDPTQFAEPRVRSVGGYLIQISVGRELEGVPVRDSYITASINSGNLILMGAHNWGSLELDTRPQIPSLQAEAVLSEHLGTIPVAKYRTQPRLAIVPTSEQPDETLVPVGDGLEYRLVWVLTPDFAKDLGDWEALVDADTGELLLFHDTNYYASRQAGGGIYPISNDGTPPGGVEQPDYPMPFADISLNGNPVGFTTTGGNVPTGADPGTLSTTLSGLFVNISDNCGAINESAAAGDLDLGVSGGTDCVVPPGHSPGDTHSSRTGFYELNRLIEQGQGYLPGNAWMQGQLTANMNINDDCNAFWNGLTVNFFLSAPGACGNTGEIAGVFDHEWGHGLDDNDVLPFGSDPGEGYADLIAAMRLNTSCMGRGFIIGGNCDGYGDACLDCSGVRDIDWAKHASGVPHDIAWSVANCGGCLGETHCSGMLVGESGWDLYARDLQAAPFNLDANTALQLVSRLHFIGSGTVGDWYQCSGATGDGCNADSGYLNWLAADDDNGNLSDGTPHMTAIFAAFDRHDLACPAPAPQNSGCASGPATAPANVTVNPFDEGVQVSWDAVPNATEYWIFRTEGVFGCAFGKTRVGVVTAPTTTFTETGLRNGFELFYSVVAVGATSACTSPMSACQSVTPTAGPSGFIEGTVTDAATSAPIVGAIVEAVGGVTVSDETDGTGFYRIQVPVDTYDVTADADDYDPQTVPGVQVQDGQTVTLDFALNITPVPIADVTPTSFEFTVAQGDTDSDTLNVGNIGQLDLVWDIQTDFPGVSGGALSHDPALDEPLDLPDFVLDSLPNGGSVMTFTVPGGVATSGEVVGFSFVGTVSGISGNFSYASDMCMRIEAPDGTTFTVGGFSGTGQPGCLDNDWDFQGQQSDEDGTYSSDHDDIYPGIEDDGTWTFSVVNDWESAASGTMSWTDVTVTLHKTPPPICDVITEVPWLSASPDAGTTTPGNSTPVTVTVDAGTLSIGTHEVGLCVNTNDPDAAVVEVPVTVTVTGQGPIADITPASFDFSVAAGGSDSGTLNMGNTGTGDLVWSLAESETLTLAPYAPGEPVDFNAPRGYDRASGIAPAGPAADQRVLPSTKNSLVGTITEGFDDITTLPGAGWALINNSEPLGLTNWFQGNDLVFPAQDGAPTAYIGANFNNTAGAGTISNWLLTPEVTLQNGTELRFWTRTPAGSTFPDRLEVRMSTSGTSTDVGATSTSVGDFTELLLEINPDLAVGGYPEAWTEFVVTVSGLPSATTGRFGLRYFVTNAGPAGINSNYIGIDTLSVTQVGGGGGCTSPSDIPWLSENPTSGSTSPGGSVPVTVTVDSAGLAPGTYTANVCASTNDPGASLVAVPVTLEVVQAVPAIQVDPPNLTSTLQPGQTEIQPLTISNTGTATLNWTATEAAGSLASAGVTGIAAGTAASSARKGTAPAAGASAEAELRAAAVARGAVGAASVGAADLSSAIGGPLPSLQIINSGLGGIDCDTAPGIIIHDDGTLENGYSGNPLAGVTEVRFVDEFTPTSYPATFTSVCLGFITGSGPTTYNVLVEVYDDDGTGGSPGTLLGSVPATVTVTQITVPIPPGQTAEWTSVDISSLGINVTSGSVFIGANWAPAGAGLANVFVAADQTLATPLAGGFWWNNNDAVWAPIDVAFPDYRAIMVRAVQGATIDCTVPTDVPWLSVNPTSGSVAPGANQVANVTFDATGLAPGVYEAGVCVSSNDPVNPVVTVPVTLTVEAAAPIADVNPDSFSFEVPLGGGATDELSVGNLGTLNLDWSITEDAPAPVAGGGALSHDPALDEPLDLPDFVLDSLPNGGSVMTFTVPGGVLTNGQVMGFSFVGTVTGISGNFSWASDMCMRVEAPDGTTYVVGGISGVGMPGCDVNDWAFQGSVSDEDGTYSSDHDDVFAGLEDDGTWTISVVNDWDSASSGTMSWTDVTVTLLKAAPPLCDDVTEVPWLSASPTSGVTEPGATDIVDVAVDSTGLAAGLYEAALCVATNDAAAPVVTVPVSLTVSELVPTALVVDPDVLVSDGNGVFEPGEQVDVAPSWLNSGASSVALTGTASNFTGPAGATYTIAAAAADYGVVASGATASCLDTGTCYALEVSDPAPRPVTHWDATFDEQLSEGATKTWTLHLGESYTDVPRTSLFYGGIETLLHNVVSSVPQLARRDLQLLGCTDTEFCPTLPTTRREAAPLLLKTVEGPGYVPPPCTGVFNDVPTSSPFCPWVEELFNRGITAGCGGGNYCPHDPVTRAEMAVFLLKTLEGPSYTPPACTGIFTDVPCPSLFADWIEELFNRGITAGCTATTYCPADAVLRQETAVFLTKTFDLTLYGP